MTSPRDDITVLLSAAAAGDAVAQQLLWQHPDIQCIARSLRTREQRGAGFQTGVLVSEAYLKLAGDGESPQAWQNRRHFFAAVTNAMRQFLVEESRKRNRLKRGKDWKLVPGELAMSMDAHSPATLLAIDVAIEKLCELDAQQGEIVKLRFWCGLTLSEIAKELGLADRTVDKYWRRARAFLFRELS